jgi:hypothetical protein
MSKKSSNINLFAFWEYDLYPYMLGGVASSMNDEGYVYIKSYQSWFNPFKLVPIDIGKILYVQVEGLREEYRIVEAELKKEYTDRLLNLIPSHPKAKAK